MSEAHLIPPNLPPRTFRGALLAAAFGASIGVVLSVIAWLVTNDARWFYAVPFGALVGVGLYRHRPNVLWGHRVH